MNLYRIAIAAALLILPLQAEAHQAIDKRLLKFIPDVPSQEIPDKPGQIKRGRELFLNGTFGGNGRTCGTCHEPTNNFTIDPTFIATLPPTSPLFVNETQPALAGLENSHLLRGFGLICENLDGFLAGTNQGCVFRGVPHTLGLPTSIAPEAAPFPLVNALGWSGDGAPGDGSLNQFAVGAVIQHFTKNPLRRPNIDFVLPSKQQLRQMEAFQRSLGRRVDVSLDDDNDTPAIIFKDATAEAGKHVFVDGVPGRAGVVRSCNSCHDDAGALDANGNNRQRDTGVRLAANAPACRDPVAPGDGGFLSTPVTTDTIPSCGAQVTFRGNGQFNTPPLIEAADTAPFFSNNSAATLEDSIRHYTSDAFNNSPAGGKNAFVLSPTQVNQISALLRALNAAENLRDSAVVTRQAVNEGKPLADQHILQALSNTRDALQVLNQSPVVIYNGSGIRPLINQAIAFQQGALAVTGMARKVQLMMAAARLDQARTKI